MKKLNFIQLNPRTPIGEQPEYDLGIEVTIPGMKNDLDHHGETANLPSASEQTLEKSEELLKDISGESFTIATVRPDSDSVTAMAVIKAINDGTADKIDKGLVRLIGILDRLGIQGLSKEEKTEDQHKKVTAIGYISSDFKRSLSEKVDLVGQILHGTIDQQIIENFWNQKQKDFAEAKENLEVHEIIPGKLVVVIGKHRMASSIGYEYANTFIALNPEMPVLENKEGKMIPTDKTYKKYTIAKYNEMTPTDINALLKELQTLEAGRGGRGTIIGSPQNVSSELSIQQVIEIVKKHIQ